MYHRVKIKKLPNKAFGGTKTGQQTADGALAIQPTAMGGADIDQYIGEKPKTVQRTLQPIAREKANVEVEKGEIVAGDLNGDGMIETYIAGGKRHSQGGTPLNLPDDTFIFSDTASMRIKDPNILAKFGKSKGSYTPADIAKQYDVNKYRKILQDPDSDAIDRKTAELMIRNYTMKLGGLALAQEGKKGFPQGIPMISNPFLEANGISPEQLMPTYQPMLARQEEEPETTEGIQEEVAYDESMPSAEEYMQMQPEEAPMAAYGMQMGGFNMPYTSEYGYGGLVKAQKGITVKPSLSKSEKEMVDQKWNGDVDAYFAFKKSAEAIKGDKEFRKKLHEQYKKVIAETNYYTAKEKGKENWYSALKNRSEQEVIDALLAQEERNARLAAYGLDPYKTSQPPVKGSNINKETQELIQNTPGLQDLDFSKGYLSQAAYIAYDDLVGRNKGKQRGSKQTGFEDELTGRPAISGIGNASTNTTLGQRLYYIPEKDESTTTTKTTTEEAKKGTRPGLETIPFQGQDTVTYPGWTAPDIRNYFGTIKDKARVKKYFPWAAPVDLEEATPVYLDPTRELAAQSEQANMLTQSLAQFVGPQGLSSRTSGVQGVGARQAADTLSRYNNANVNIANQFANQNAQIRNQERLQNQAIAKDLYDKTVFTNQAYDNAMAAADQAQRQAFATGWKNASDIAMINATSNQYDIDPFSGTVRFTGGKNVTPEKSTTFNTLLDEYIKKGFEPKEAIQAAKIAMGSSSGYYPGIDGLLERKDGGGMYVLGDTIFPFMFY